MIYFKAEVLQIWFGLGLCPRSRLSELTALSQIP